MNRILAETTLNHLFSLGVREICVCPGSRNAPWIQLLTEKSSRPAGEILAHYFFEERSAAFFALGRIRATGRPVAVATTSGTAAGELLPAAMEAHYSGLPLILLTADRPRRFRGTGAPQTAEQVGIFSHYCKSADLEGGEKPLEQEPLSGPFHFNVCFEEPTKAGASEPVVSPAASPVSSKDPSFTPAEVLEHAKHPFVIVGSLSAEDRPAVREFLLRFGAPAYFEAQSGLRECRELERVRIHVGEKIFDRAQASGYAIDGVLRIGGVPTHRMWRDLEDRFPLLPALNVSRLPFAGLARSSANFFGNISKYLGELSVATSPLRGQGLFEADRVAKRVLYGLLESEPNSEPGIFNRLSAMLPERARLFLGNSLPIREWDLAASWEDRGFEVLATRGVNGIDGQISTFLGLCESDRPNWGIFGDLTALYDMAGPWALSQLSSRVDVVVINNGGGKIFDRMYPQREFQNPHRIRFEGLAALWGMDYLHATEVDMDWRRPLSDKSRLIELAPDEAATARFWKEYLKS